MSVPAQAVADIIKEQPAWVDLRKERNYLKIFWNRGYNNWTKTEFKEHMRVDRGTF